MATNEQCYVSKKNCRQFREQPKLKEGGKSLGLADQIFSNSKCVSEQNSQSFTTIIIKQCDYLFK